MEQCLWLFYIASVKNRLPRENVPRFWHWADNNECVIVRPKMCYCTISTGNICTSCVYSFPTDKIFSLISKSSIFSVLIYLFIYFAMSPLHQDPGQTGVDRGQSLAWKPRWARPQARLWPGWPRDKKPGKPWSSGQPGLAWPWQTEPKPGLKTLLSQVTGQTGQPLKTKASLASDKSKTTVAAKVSWILI